MQDYRLYCLDGVQRIARAADVIRAPSDDDAVEAARRTYRLPYHHARMSAMRPRGLLRSCLVAS